MSDGKIIFVAGKFGHLPAKGTCAECPLRRDSKRGALGGWTPEMYLEGMLSYVDFACHMSKGFSSQDKDAMRSCTGVANFRANCDIGLPRGNARDAKEFAGRNTVDVFDDLMSFYIHHRK